jgi:hypothetical protein
MCDDNLIGRTLLLNKENEPKNTTIYFTNSQSIAFNGKHLQEREKPNWHYYATDDGMIIHCRKEHMVCVIEKADERNV